MCVNWLCHRKSFSGHGCIFVVLVFYSLMYDGILQMFPLKKKRFHFLPRYNQLLYKRHRNPIYFLSAIANQVLLGVRGPRYLPHVAVVLRNIVQNIFFPSVLKVHDM